MIFWEEINWRRAAPNFDAFMELFDLYDADEFERREVELEERFIQARNASHWRRVAPSFAAFMELIEPYEFAEFRRRMREVYL